MRLVEFFSDIEIDLFVNEFVLTNIFICDLDSACSERYDIERWNSGN